MTHEPEAYIFMDYGESFPVVGFTPEPDVWAWAWSLRFRLYLFSSTQQAILQQSLTVMFGGLHDSLPYGDGTTYQSPLASQAESRWFKKIWHPTDLWPQRQKVGNWLELVVIKKFHITWLHRHTDLSRTCTVTVQQFDLVYCLLCFLVYTWMTATRIYVLAPLRF